MTASTLLVIGIHRDELAFGDAVAALIDRAAIDVMRIAQGIPQPRRAPGDLFISQTQHREIYLQLHQQVRGRFDLLIDLHCGTDTAGLGAELFCQDISVAHRIKALGILPAPKLIPIGAPQDTGQIHAKTWIPRRVWTERQPIYLGIEIYLPASGEEMGSAAEYASEIISALA